MPAPGKPPVLRVPAWTRTALANGAELVVSEKHDLPLVSFSITFMGGADQFEKADKRGVASLTAAMLSEGTKTRDGEALSNALQLLGGNVSTSVAGESGSMGFVSTAGKFPQTLDILADMMLNSTFPDDALAAPGRVDAGACPAWHDRRPRLPAGPLRGQSPVRSDDDRGHTEGDHA